MAETKAVEETVLDSKSNAVAEMEIETESTDLAQQGQIQIGMRDGHLEIEDLVVNPTWREILMNLIVGEQLDPWNLDIIEITSKYIQRVKEMKTLDLHLPANVILAAAILLRLKSETLKLETEEQVAENETYLDDSPIGEVQMLHLRMRVPPKRTITLADLVNALEEVMSLEKVRDQRKKERVNVIELKLPTYDIEKEMASTLQKARKFADEKGWLTFSKLIQGKERTNSVVISAFLPLLYLEQENKLFILQEKLFGEILINVNIQDEPVPGN